ncbi:hypothetical protein [Sphingomonas daechungensis]|uniref:hypothetical protein n=1 Tax=Sphingomonas daechungensis TaxID=1176646 RepID=UPI001CB8C820|nr:hypothetical protein [Sphingomonas daechungensis]
MLELVTRVEPRDGRDVTGRERRLAADRELPEMRDRSGLHGQDQGGGLRSVIGFDLLLANFR